MTTQLYISLELARIEQNRFRETTKTRVQILYIVIGYSCRVRGLPLITPQCDTVFNWSEVIAYAVPGP